MSFSLNSLNGNEKNLIDQRALPMSLSQWLLIYNVTFKKAKKIWRNTYPGLTSDNCNCVIITEFFGNGKLSTAVLNHNIFYHPLKTACKDCPWLVLTNTDRFHIDVNQ